MGNFFRGSAQIIGNKTEIGGEPVQYNPVISEAKEEDGSAVMLEMMGLKAEDMVAFGIIASMMNVQAYGIAAVMPAEGKTEAVTEALQGYIDLQKMNFEFYLADRYEVAGNTRLETLGDGTVLMVMCADSDKIFDAISAAVLEGQLVFAGKIYNVRQLLVVGRYFFNN